VKAPDVGDRQYPLALFLRNPSSCPIRIVGVGIIDPRPLCGLAA
jgi:hypothetical protein